ncbi:tRNA dihydrouridine synthase [Phycisphaera mikurensis]|uniref:tRNA-dihydrouridine synthase n=1 Tax=Phycisphaera mikurensis (strain NBRC 102666 / KCTC 22515 / FYK2301M01) TaxID=1142394 RepID=I0II18_PHYMF|nr:tRNA-dihydrouridine synthase family protein [Phycisphaera mikurensis]MBB6442530.1 tRNA-dihydrouridine synthase [Phycisphaera mikurensis]BAM04906.1 putative tRNA-dihydrouridine synthase [Phycisphaera mikurensis NBRC 102666]
MLKLGGQPGGPAAVPVAAPFFQAGLAGYSDASMRRIARRHGCPFCVTEAMLDRFLVNGGKGLAAAELDADDRGPDAPIAGQLMGSHPDELAEGARILVKLGYDVVDVNLACPVKKIKKKARGGHLLSVPEEALDILRATMDAVGSEVPVTVKLRRGYDDSPGAEAAFARVFEGAMELGLSGATVHSRTVQQKYVGPGHRPRLREIARRYRLGAFFDGPADGSRFVLGGSGDVWTAADVFAMLDGTGVDWVSVARGCIGNPWVFRQARSVAAERAAGRMRAGEPVDLDALRPPTVFQQRDVLREHFALAVARDGEQHAGRTMRKFGIRFSRHHLDGPAIRQRFIRVKNLAEWEAVLADFYEADGPGVPTRASLPPEAPAAVDAGDALLACG